MNKLVKAASITCLLSLAGQGTVQAQGTFQNLGFEFAIIAPVPGDPYSRADFSQALPGWTGYIAGVPQSAALHDSMFLDSSGLGIIGPSWPFGGGIQGNYTAFLQAGLVLGTSETGDAALAQTALIPVSAASLRFRAQQGGGLFGSGPGELVASLGGQTLTVFPLAAGPNFTLFGANIGAWAGQTTELRFTAVATQPHVDNNNWFLDSIEFSTQQIPEPSVFALLGLGALFLGWRLSSKSKM